MTRPAWRKSSHSGPEQGDCVELAYLPNQTIAVRDSKSPSDGHLTLTSEAFAALLARAKQGELNL